MNAGKGKKAGENRDVRTCARVLQTNEFQIYRCISVSPSTKRLSYRDLSRHLFDSLSPPSRYSPRARCFLAKHSNLPCISNWNSTKVCCTFERGSNDNIIHRGDHPRNNLHNSPNNGETGSGLRDPLDFEERVNSIVRPRAPLTDIRETKALSGIKQMFPIKPRRRLSAGAIRRRVRVIPYGVGSGLGATASDVVP